MPKTIEQRLVALEKTISDFLFGKKPSKRGSNKTAKKSVRKPARKRKTSKKAAP